MLSTPDYQTARSLDKFYTRDAIVATCMARLAEIVGDELDGHDLWVEPSAGSGAFLRCLPGPKIGLDLAPTGSDIETADFLTWSPPSGARSIIVVGNPPFGRSASLAIAFFNHAAAFADRIAFIVPRTFEKTSVQRRLSHAFHLDDETVLPVDSFEILGIAYSVPTVFQIWSRRLPPRQTQLTPTSHPDFVFCVREQADFAIQRVGVNAGQVKTDLSTIASQSHYFLRASNGSGTRLMNDFRALDFTEVKQRTAGNPSVSKRELIALYAAHRARAEG